MDQNDDLFDLIQLMTKAEKRQFKLYSVAVNGSGPNNLLMLFDILARSEQYDESKLNEKFKKESFYPYLSSAKNKLNNNLQKFLSGNNYGSKVMHDLKESISASEMLHSKGLLKAAAKVINKAKIRAIEAELFDHYLSLIKIEKLILEDRQPADYYEKMNDLLNEELVISEKYIELLKYKNLNHRITHKSRVQLRYRTEDEKKQLSDLRKNKLLRDNANPLSQKARILFYHTRARIAVHEGNAEEALAELNQAFELINKWGDNYQITETSEYLSILNHYITTNLFLGNFSAVQDILPVYKELPVTTRFQEIKMLDRYYFFQFLVYLNTLQFDKIKLLEKDVEIILESSSTWIRTSRKLVYYYNLTISNFLTGNYDRALYWINCILNYPKTDIRKDMQAIARLMRMLVLYELKNQHLIDDLLRSAQRYLSSKDNLFSFEVTLLQFLKELASLPDYEVKTSCMKFHNRIQEDQAETLKMLGRSEFLVWINSKIHNISMIDVVKRKIVEI